MSRRSILARAKFIGWGQTQGVRSVCKLVRMSDGTHIITEANREYLTVDVGQPELWAYVTRAHALNPDFGSIESQWEAYRTGWLSNWRYASLCHCVNCDHLGGDCLTRPTYEEYLDEQADEQGEDFEGQRREHAREEAQAARDLCDHGDKDLPF